MALRVLLADESPTIKKVFQLALQDYAVEVKSVNVGLDVKHVAEEFHPDIVFADILLQKQNGYEVCTELKNNTNTNSVPVVLMWSGFMDLDEDKFKASAADDRIEKPFDVQALRHLVKTHVPKTSKQTLSEYLSFPTLPEIADEKGASAAVGTEPSAAADAVEESTSQTANAASVTEMPPETKDNVVALGPPDSDLNVAEEPSLAEATPVVAETPAEAQSSHWDDNSIEPVTLNPVADASENNEIDETGFTAVSMMRKKKDATSPQAAGGTEAEPWVSKDLGRFKIDDDLSQDTPPVPYTLPDAPVVGKDTHNEFDFQSPMDTNDIDLESESTFAGAVQPRGDDLQIEEVHDPEGFAGVEVEESMPGFQRQEAGPVTRKDIEDYIYAACEKHLDEILKEVIPEVAREVIQREVDKILKN